MAELTSLFPLISSGNVRGLFLACAVPPCGTPCGNKITKRLGKKAKAKIGGGGGCGCGCGG